MCTRQLGETKCLRQRCVVTGCWYRLSFFFFFLSSVCRNDSDKISKIHNMACFMGSACVHPPLSHVYWSSSYLTDHKAFRLCELQLQERVRRTSDTLWAIRRVRVQMRREKVEFEPRLWPSLLVGVASLQRKIIQESRCVRSNVVILFFQLSRSCLSPLLLRTECILFVFADL